MKVNFFFFLMFSRSNLLQHMWARKEARREGARRTWACAHTPTEHALLSGQAVGARLWRHNRGWICVVPALTETAVAHKVSPEADSAVSLCLVPLPTSRLSVAFFGSFWCNSHSNTAIPVSWQNWLVGSQRVCSFRDRVYMMRVLSPVSWGGTLVPAVCADFWTGFLLCGCTGSLLLCGGFLSAVVCRLLILGASLVVDHGLSCPTTGGIFPGQGLNPRPLHWRVDS